MIVMFTDFGSGDPYVGQMHAVLAREAPQTPVIDLLHAVPNFDIRAAAYLLPAYTRDFPTETIFLCIVDPGVGSTRRPVMLRADMRWYVGPDNGLFHVLAQQTQHSVAYAIQWRPVQLSVSFHGRDLFAPVAASLARGEMPAAEPTALTIPDGDWPGDLAQVVYIDHYGNAITGLRAVSMTPERVLRCGNSIVNYARVFSEAPSQTPFWYVNANGLVEIAVNQSSAASRLNLRVGTTLTIV